MPRRKERFSFLAKALKAAGGTAEAGSKLAGYKDFKDGKKTIEVTKKLTSAQRQRKKIALLPFNFTPPADLQPDNHYTTLITVYSNAGRTDLALTNGQLGYTATAAGNISENTFYPALLRVFVPTNAETPEITNPTSQITGNFLIQQSGI
ncbi:hypothetical protein [Nostoc sp.]|uniref:hypothetical protein n=1 Tax=Nostoc sp. TaxID=1180 RepID=UPI002FF4F27E